MSRLFISTLAVILTCTCLAQAFSNLTINGNSSPNSSLSLQPNTEYTVSFDTTNDDSNSQWVALLVLDYLSPVPGARPLMPVCVLAGGLETSTIGSDAIGGSTISFSLDLPPLVIPSSILAGVEVGELTPDGVVLLSTLFTFLGDRIVLTAVESAGVPLDLVETLCSDYATTINATALVCVGGSGPDNYADICNFACTNGFCPSPCSCTSTGAGNSPTPADAIITGSAAPGLDSATFDPLCNFACPRGFCPENVCDLTIQATPPMDLPAISNVTAFDTSALGYYVDGDSFYFQSPDDDQLSLTLSLLGTAQTWDDMDCGDEAAPGPDGDTLGCVAMAVAYLNYAIALGQADSPDVASRSLAIPGANFEVHPQWSADKNCTTRCKLLAGAPVNTWVRMGNGTFNGIPHEVQFMHNENMTQHGVLQYPSPGSLSAAGELASRANVYYIGSIARLRADMYNFDDKYTWDPLQNTYISNDQLPQTDPIMAGQAVADAVSETQFEQYCMDWIQEGTIGSANLITISESGNPLLDPIDASNASQECATRVNQTMPFVVWPYDRTKTASADQLITSLGGLASNSVVNPTDILYWTANLTPVDRTRVQFHPQILEVEDECFNDCFEFFSSKAALQPNRNRDFAFRPSDNPIVGRKLKPLEFDQNPSPVTNKTLKTRDSVVTFTPNVDLDLSFISQAPPIPANTLPDGKYTYDVTLGRGVNVYVLDGDFNLGHTEFTTANAGINGNPPDPPLSFKATIAPLLNGQASEGDQDQHGTRMMGTMAGVTKGVASNITPILYRINPNQDKRFITNNLDRVLADWNGRKGTSATPLAVLSMSWGVRSGPYHPGFQAQLRDRLNELITAGVLPVAATGNGNSPSKRPLPALFGDPFQSDWLSAMMAVGGVENNGERWTSEVKLGTGSNYFTGAVYAPAHADTAVVAPGGSSTFDADEGTSISSAKTAGLAAYLISLSSTWNIYAPGFSVDANGVGNGQVGSPLSLNRYIRGQLAYTRDLAARFPAIYNGAFIPPSGSA